MRVVRVVRGAWCVCVMRMRNVEKRVGKITIGK